MKYTVNPLPIGEKNNCQPLQVIQKIRHMPALAQAAISEAR